MQKSCTVVIRMDCQEKEDLAALAKEENYDCFSAWARKLFRDYKAGDLVKKEKKKEK